MKRINEVFKDYQASGNINTAIVESVVLKKKTKTLEMKISSDKYIDVKEFEGLNKFIRRRFALNDSKVSVKYAEGTVRKPIKEELHNIMASLGDQYPALKAVLNSSEYEVNDNVISINFKVPVSRFLKSMNYDKKIYSAVKTCMAQPIK